MFHIKPVLVNAARVFIKDDASVWSKDVRSKCLAVNRMASDPQVYQAYSQALASSSQHAPTLYVNLENFLDSLLSLLWDKLRQTHSDSRYSSHLKALYERLRSTRIIVRNYKDEKTMGRIEGLICEAGVFIYYQTDFVLLSDLLQRFDVFLARVELKTVLFKAKEELILGDIEICERNEFDNATPIWGHQPQPSSSITSSVVSFHPDEVTPVLDRLTWGSKELRIVPISGMAGLGKTTFALVLFNHPHVMNHFRDRAWSPISQVFDRKKVLLQLLNQIHESPESYSNMPVEELANKLRQRLKGKRYLILLDDVWTPEVWNSLKASFPNDSTGSRIIMTSRRLDITTCSLLDEQPHLLRLREDNECLKILETKLTHKQGWNLAIGEKISRMCKGLPLTLGIVAGVLATTEEENWNGILDQLDSSGVPGAESALELSYEQLPDYLQPCFLYFGAFPEDENISVRWMILLWMAEGFVGGNDKSMEQVAREYMEKLIERNLVMVVESRSIGGVKDCRMHDLIHEFCRIKAKKESFFHLLLERRDELFDFNEPCNLQRLSIYSSANHFKLSKLFCPRAQSILFFLTGKWWLCVVSSIIQVFQLLHVLDISIFVLENGIPNEIDGLTQLRYLSVSSRVPVIPSSVGNLPNLETFIAYFHTRAQVSFPHTLWNLGKLKYLHLYSMGQGFIFPTENLENSSSLLELETLRFVAFYCDDDLIEKQMRKFPNLRRLKCAILPRVQSREVSHKIVIPEFPSQLETLTLLGSYKVDYVFGSSPASLRKLKMVEFELSKEDIQVIGKLPNLEVLKLFSIHLQENILDMEDAEFPKLRILELNDLDTTLERWTASDDQLPSLVKLVFWNCLNLEEIPRCLEMSPTLEEIQVHKCSSTLEGLVRDVEEVQVDFGNSIKVRITSLNQESYD